MGILANAGIGMLAGGAIGGAGNNWRWEGMAGGAALGGVGLAVGGWGLNRMGGVSRLASRGMEYARGGVAYAQSGLAGIAQRQLNSNGLNIWGQAAGYGALGMRGAGMGLASVHSFIGNNSTAINKYGGYALGAMGVASAANIGSSILSSNRGY
jgi:hypothetical protein